MAGTADLAPDAGGELGRVDYGQSFIKNGFPGQSHVLGTWTMAGLAADVGFRKCVLLQIYACGVTAATFLDCI